MPLRPLQARMLLCASLCLFAPLAVAKQLRDVRGPAETPPTSFTATQYVDSTGCIFVRAGVDGNVTWIPRVTRDRQVMCGQRPSLGGARPVQTASVAAAPAAASSGVARVIEPVVPAMGLAPAAPVAKAAPRPVPTLPTGYRAAWKDDRLNPLRGTGQVRATRPAAAEAAVAVAPVPKASVAGGRYVQVGVFADPANAARTIARLQALGLPVTQQPMRANGRQAASVAAGPFAAGDVAGALGLVRAQGFADAFLR